MIEYIGYGLVGLGVFFNVLSAVALIRFPDVYSRLSSSTKCITLGIVSILLGVTFVAGLTATGIKALLAIGFVLITFPIEAHVLSRAARVSGISTAPKTEKGAASDK